MISMMHNGFTSRHVLLVHTADSCRHKPTLKFITIPYMDLIFSIIA